MNGSLRIPDSWGHSGNNLETFRTVLFSLKMGNPNVYKGGAGLFTAEYEKGRAEPPL